MIQMQLVTRILRKSTPVLIAAVVAIGLLASAPHGLAVTMTWTNGSALWTSTTAWTTNQATGIDPVNSTNITCGAGAVSNISATCVGGNGVPGINDQARFTNDTSYTVTISSVTNSTLTVSNTVPGAVLTLNAAGSSLTVTGRFRVGDGGATSTVVWAGGTLSAANGAVAVLQMGPSSNSFGTFMVTAGTVVAGGSLNVGGAEVNGAGKLVVSGSSVFTNNIGKAPNDGLALRMRSQSQLIITNGGKYFWAGETRAQSNSLILVSDPGSSLICTGIQTSVLTIGDLDNSPGSMLIVSNGAKVVANNGTVSIGRNNGSSNTGIVVGAGSQLIATNAAGITVGLGSAVHHDNALFVYDGGSIFLDGPFFNISGTGTNCSFHMGGVGGMSTGVAVAVRHNSQALNSSMVMSNALFTCTKMSVNGSLNNKLSVLAKATLNVTAPDATETNALNVSAVSGVLTINAGTINAVTGTNGILVTVGGSGTLTGNSLIITNGGNLFADAVKVQGANTIVFTSGTLSVGGMDIRPNANGSNVFVVGDGNGLAYYDMTANGDGYHGFSNGGVVFTNSASLRGSGTLAGTTTVLGRFVPGFANAVGSIFTSNSLSFGNAAVLNYDLGTISDSVTVNGNLGLGNSTINVTDSGGFGAGTYVLFTHTNTVVSGTLNVGTLPSGFGATVSNDVDSIPARTLLVVNAVVTDPYASWTSHYGLAGGNALGTADPDGDGMNNTNEFLAGFDPTNSAAYVHIISTARSGNDILVTYLGANGNSTTTPSITSRTNVLEATTGTGNGSYATNGFAEIQRSVLSGGNGSGTVTSFTDVSGATGATKYYRVRVLVP